MPAGQSDTVSPTAGVPPAPGRTLKRRTPGKSLSPSKQAPVRPSSADEEDTPDENQELGTNEPLLAVPKSETAPASTSLPDKRAVPPTPSTPQSIGSSLLFGRPPTVLRPLTAAAFAPPAGVAAVTQQPAPAQKDQPVSQSQSPQQPQQQQQQNSDSSAPAVLEKPLRVPQGPAAQPATQLPAQLPAPQLPQARAPVPAQDPRTRPTPASLLQMSMRPAADGHVGSAFPPPADERELPAFNADVAGLGEVCNSIAESLFGSLRETLMANMDSLWTLRAHMQADLQTLIDDNAARVAEVHELLRRISEKSMRESGAGASSWQPPAQPSRTSMQQQRNEPVSAAATSAQPPRAQEHMSTLMQPVGAQALHRQQPPKHGRQMQAQQPQPLLSHQRDPRVLAQAPGASAPAPAAASAAPAVDAPPPLLSAAGQFQFTGFKAMPLAKPM